MSQRAAQRVVVVGASAAGLATVEALRAAGHTGQITLVGEEAHTPYDRPPLSKHLLSGDWEPDRLALRPDDALNALDLDLRLATTAVAADITAHTVTLSDGAVLDYDALVIATGVRPRPLPGVDGHVIRTLDDALQLRSRLRPGTRVAVVGAGFLGAETAAVARSLGCRVTLVEPAPAPLSQALGDAVGNLVADLHRAHGVDLRTGVGVVSTSDGSLALSDGSSVGADLVVVAIGSLPNTEWLTGSGLTLADGVVCDHFCQAAPGVWAAGDVARWHNPLFDTTMRIEHRTNAAEQGTHVARNLLARPEDRRRFAPVPYFWSDQYGIRLQAYGYLRDHDEAVLLDADADIRRLLMGYRRGERLVGVLGVGLPPRQLRGWRAAIAGAMDWAEIGAVSDAV